MKEYSKLMRLMAQNEIGNRHISVENHISKGFPQHWHDYFEIEIVVEGSGTHILNGNAYPISKGDAYLLTPVDFHEIKSPAGIEMMNISFDEICLSENMRSFLYTLNFKKMQRLNEKDYPHMLMAAQLLRYESESDNPCVQQILDYLLSRFVRLDAKSSIPVVNQEQMTGIKKAVAYIELHFREKVTLQRLSAISGYNPTYFSELFRKFTGDTYIERLTALRINYAKALLASGLSVSNACFESGFGSLSNFLVVFKSKCGMTPSEYQKRSKEL